MELVTGQPKIVAVGEGMIELSIANGAARLGFGGDTLNTAIHLARFGLPTAFFTALGTDHFSDDLRSAISNEGLDTSLILTDPDRHPGIYAIHTDSQGERSFTYWRSQSAARRMFALQGSAEAIERAREADLLYFSLITLAILPPDGREELFGLARDVRSRGGLVAFDGNYRPRLWRDVSEASEMRDAASGLCDIGLPSLDDERLLSGFESEESVAAHWQASGAAEVVVKMGRAGAFADGHVFPPIKPPKPVDTTGAGDAFNAGYLAARLKGENPTAAVLAGHLLGGWVVAHRGAVPPAGDHAPYDMTT